MYFGLLFTVFSVKSVNPLERQTLGEEEVDKKYKNSLLRLLVVESLINHLCCIRLNFSLFSYHHCSYFVVRFDLNQSISLTHYGKSPVTSVHDKYLTVGAGLEEPEIGVGVKPRITTCRSNLRIDDIFHGIKKKHTHTHT